MRYQFKALPASAGLAVGPAWVYRPVQVSVEKYTTPSRDFEWDRLGNAIELAHEQLASLILKATESLGAEREIFQAHAMFLDDPELLSLLHDLIFGDKVNAEYAVHTVTEQYAAMLLGLEDEYLQARSMDIRDVGQRILYNLSGINPEDVELPENPVVIVAEDLTPSDTVKFDRKKVLGFCIVRGGPTSHVAILARSFGVPATVKTPLELNQVQNGQTIILDGNSGEVIINPDAADIQATRVKQSAGQQDWDSHFAKADLPAITRDGRRFEVVANIGGAEDALQAVRYGAEGVGLLRTEFLYLDRESMPGNEDQIQVYREIFDIMGPRPVVVRTLDIGGDKTVGYLGIKEEANPFLGWRSIRMINERPEVLYDQLYALLQAGAGSDLRIMLPMVSNLHEVEHARSIFESAADHLKREGKQFAQNVQLGMMVEVPSAAILANHFAKVVDFFSIGTNDLTQYTLAVDRTNARVADLASPFDPAVITLIERTISAAHAAGKWVGLCGEMAGDPLAVPLLVGLGLDEFSMAPRSIPTVKDLIRGLSTPECQRIAQDVLALPTKETVIAYLKQVF